MHRRHELCEETGWQILPHSRQGYPYQRTNCEESASSLGSVKTVTQVTSLCISLSIIVSRA